MAEEFPDLRTTGFGSEGLAKMRSGLESWQIGESFSECFLEDHRGAFFPYPSWQDLKNQDASPAGADLVGYDCQNDSTVFLFGEVKTSSQDHHPPSVVNDLKRQLLDLQSHKTLNQLLLWLGGKNKTQKDKQDFSKSLAEYVKGIFKIVGILIRDTILDKRDLEDAFAHLADALRPAIILEMLAIYLPVPLNTIPRIMDGKSDYE